MEGGKFPDGVAAAGPAKSRILDGRYALPADFREGGMAKVYRAADLENDSRTVAVKILKRDHGDRVVSIAFERETSSLLQLSHPNIVRLLDAGRDPERGERYLVFEWMEDDLESVIGNPRGWEDYLRRWGLPILRGLAHAHESEIAHRDLKPANVLLDAGEQTQISDFGLAKIATALEPGRTLRDWHSPPYSPREAETEENRYSRDVHAYGVLSLMILAGVNPNAPAFPERYEAIDEALSLLKCPEEIADLLARCVSTEVAERPLDAVVALATLERILAARRAAAHTKRPVLYVSIGSGARRYLEDEFDLGANSERERFLAEEFAEGVGIATPNEEEFSDGSSTEGHYIVYANTMRLHAALSQDREQLHLITALAMRPSYLERERERATAVDFEWRFGLAEGEGERGIRALERLIEEHNAEERRAQAGSAAGLITRWRRLLTAMKSVEMNRAIRHPYTGRRPEGRAIRFKCPSDVPVELLGPVIVESSGSGFLRGVATLFSGREVLARITEGDLSEVPPRGEIRTDTGGTTVAIKRQHRALDSIEESRSVRPDLRDLIVHPERARPPIVVPVLGPHFGDLGALVENYLPQAGAEQLLLRQARRDREFDDDGKHPPQGAKQRRKSQTRTSLLEDQLPRDRAMVFAEYADRPPGGPQRRHRRVGLTGQNHRLSRARRPPNDRAQHR